MKSIKLSNDLVELEESEMVTITAGEGTFYSFGRKVHNAYCGLRDWARNYEGDPYIRLKMGGL